MREKLCGVLFVIVCTVVGHPRSVYAQALCPFDEETGCRYCGADCNPRPEHPQPHCNEGRVFYDYSGDPAVCADFWPSAPEGECIPYVDGTEPELPNGLDDNCDGVGLGDEFCDGVDNDNDSLIDEDAGSCLMRIAFAPSCWSGSDAEFVFAAQVALDNFAIALGLDACSDRVGQRFILPSEVISELGTIPCPVCSSFNDFDRVATQTGGVLENAGILDPANYTAMHYLTDADPCAALGIKGGALGKYIWGMTAFPDVFAHEVGHVAGLGEEYCSVDHGSTCFNSDYNPLEPQYGCDNCCTNQYRLDNETIQNWRQAADPSEPCGDPGTNVICCAGNRSADPETLDFKDGDGRCIMSHQEAQGPRGYCPACLVHWQSLDNGSGVELKCDATYPGAEPIIDLAGAIVPARGLLRGVVAEERVQRRGFSAPPTSGDYSIRLLRDGELLYEAFVAPPTDHRSDEPRESVIVHAQIPVLAGGSGLLTHVELFEGGELLSQTTLNGSPPEADAGEDQTVECVTSGQAVVGLDGAGSKDADGDTLSYEWYTGGFLISEEAQAVAQLPLGEHEVFLTVDDGSNYDIDTVTIDVVDTTPPQWEEYEQHVDLIRCEPSGGSAATVVLVPPIAWDACGDVAPPVAHLVESNGVPLPTPVELEPTAAELSPGDHVIRWSTVDEEGNPTETFQSVSLGAAIHAEDHLEVRDGVRVRTASGQDAGVTSGGSQQSSFGAYSRIGEVLSKGPLFFQNYATVTGVAASEGAISTQHGASIADEQQFTSVMVSEANWLEPVLGVAFGTNDYMLEPDQSDVLDGTTYGRIHVKSRSELTLTQSQVAMTELFLEPDAVVVLEQESTRLIIRDRWTHRGTVVAGGPGQNAEVFVLGTQVGLDRSITGINLVAPNARVTVSSQAQDTRVPQLVGRVLEIQPHITLWCDGDTTLCCRPRYLMAPRAGCSMAIAPTVGFAA